MSEDLGKLQRLLEQATAATDVPAEELDPEAASLRDTWIGFGQLLEAAQPARGTEVVVEAEHTNRKAFSRQPPPSPVTSRRRSRRWLLSAAALLAASLLIGILTTWAPRTPRQSDGPSSIVPETAAITAPAAALTQQHETPKTAAEPRWDDSLDEPIAQVGQQVASAQENQLSRTDEFALMQYRIEQFRQEVQADSL